MEERTLKRLEYDKILEQLAGYSVSPLGREKALELAPSTNIDAISRWQAETTQGRELLRLEPTAEVGGWYDVRRQVEQARRGLVLEPEELLAVGRTLTAGRRVKKFLLERQEKYPLLYEIGVDLGLFGELEQRINESILPGGEIADRASSALSQIRRSLVNLQAQIKARLENIIRSPAYQKYLQDPIVTIRDNRYVVPVKQEYRSEVPGIIHDQSASGATLFIEPMAVVEANNEIRRLQAAEKQEIAKILAELSAGVASRADDLSASLEALGRLDLIMAKARYSLKLNAWEPQMLPGTRLDIRQGRHPLLSGDVVPVSIHLGRDFNTVIITGPNTGGKTVTLKTVGLLTLMAQSGLHIPAGPGTGTGIFREVFADIGDEQSIEQSLSTFSSHMKNIVGIIAGAGPESLVLLDELGAGTDPAEGAALAQAILERLHSSGAKTVATTHYSELKNFAYSTDGVENASVEFDPVTLRPTYRLLIGRPGRSNAFEIASRLGLNPGVVERAREFVGVEQVKAAELMNNLERERQQAERDREEAEKLRREAEVLLARYREMEQNLIQRRETVLDKAREEARVLVRNARLETEETVRELRERISSDAAREREMGIHQARQKLKEMQGRIYAKAPSPKSKPSGIRPGDVTPGQEIFLPKYNQKGFVLAAPDGDQVHVQVGIIKVNVPLSEIQVVETRAAGGGCSQVGALVSGKAREVSTKLDLRGMTFDEAWPEIEKYLDDAYLAGLPKVYLVHGKGTGALRTAVQRELKGHHRVKTFRLGDMGEGGMGVTVVDLK
ncbi:recombination inhibitory protein MutS2 [Desulfocucumis palustris]|uniref:Endonuclease MutS2 n=1 Tax=Desulfocucumis palustris TaxID=1898651 RepID=A0A2L2X927_9FIRM|nr:endonuclease MutS2 [Desulfocucumis palustris]GBF32729.1 recombination inhibitory protein MutS2 [Desulfocucumis palustris]